jgi:regulator of sirC expression with transglutaminase-like and TPR domain
MLDQLLRELADDPNAPLDVAEVALYLAADEYPDLFIPDYLQQLDDLADGADSYAGGAWEERVAGLCYYLFDEEGFVGNTADYYDPCNSYMNDVLDRRLGLPITLSVLAMSVGARLGLDIVGIGLPGHFIAKAEHGSEALLFDPFHGGQFLTIEACEQLVQAVTGHPFQLTTAALTATPNAMIVMRMLNNLKNIYAQRDDYRRTARILQRQRQLAPNDLTLRRDLGITLVRAEQPGPALDHLHAYLKAASAAPDAADIRTLLAQAKRDIARWN